MNAKEKFSDEFLNAFLDGQLDEDERCRLLDQVRCDPALSGRLCELQKVREMVQLAYHNVTVPQQYKRPARLLDSRYAKALAAGLLLAIGVLVGWVCNASLDRPPTLLDLARAVQTPTATRPSREWRVMLHVSTADPARLNAVLNETEHLLSYSHHSARKVRVEILTNGNGLELLNADNSPYARRVRRLEREYGNLTFLACGEALQRLKEEKGINLDLVKGTKVVPSALDEIIKRKREGWTYIHI